MIRMLRMGLEFTTAKTLQYICIYYVNVLENILTYIKHVNSVICGTISYTEQISIRKLVKFTLKMCMVNVYIISQTHKL